MAPSPPSGTSSGACSAAAAAASPVSGSSSPPSIANGWMRFLAGSRSLIGSSRSRSSGLAVAVVPSVVGQESSRML
uniref:Putative secreted peptide n=1 Tax=Anopheles braziliensis TaxID=58242 RepID=A0A2M3ZV32_9DIPT